MHKTMPYLICLLQNYKHQLIIVKMFCFISINYQNAYSELLFLCI